MWKAVVSLMNRPRLEIGPGHGWLALEQLRASADNQLTALDVSPHSVAYTRQVLTVNGIDPARYDLRQANAQRALDTIHTPVPMTIPTRCSGR